MTLVSAIRMVDHLERMMVLTSELLSASEMATAKGSMTNSAWGTRTGYGMVQRLMMERRTAHRLMLDDVKERLLERE
jgi:hypothetical protein